MGEKITSPEAMREHMSGRLFERGFIAKNAFGELAITDTGRALIRRQDS